MPRSALPQNYIMEQGLVWEGFESGHGWTFAGAEGSIETDTEHFIEGTQSIKLNGDRSVQLRKTFGTPIDFSNKSRMLSLQFYLSEEDFSNFDILYLNLFTSADWSQSFQTSFQVDRVAGSGWNTVTIHRDAWTIHDGAPSWNDPIQWAYLKLNATSGHTCSISLDNIRYNVHQEPMCGITFDDGAASAYAEAYPYMLSKGIRGTFYITPTLIASTPNFMTEANLATVYANGFAVANHTWDHPHLDALTEAQVTQEIEDTIDYLDNLGFTRTSRHLAYPYGEHGATVQAVMEALGILTGRLGGVTNLFRAPLGNVYEIPLYIYLDENLSLATAKSRIDEAIATDSSIFTVGHVLAESAGANTWAIADFQALIDYIVARKIKCVTIDEWYKGLTNPRYRSTSLSRSVRG